MLTGTVPDAADKPSGPVAAPGTAASRMSVRTTALHRILSEDSRCVRRSVSVGADLKTISRRGSSRSPPRDQETAAPMAPLRCGCRGDRLADRLAEIRSAPVGVHSIVVLPFSAVDTDRGDQAYLTMGFADAIITRLTELQPLKVMPTATTRHFVARSNHPPRSPGARRRRGAQWIGAAVGRALRVTLKLIRVRDGRQIWAGSFDERFTDVFTVQDSITQAVTSNLMLGIAPPARHARRETTTAPRTRCTCAPASNGRGGPRRRSRRGRMFNEVIAKDRAFAPAYAGIADAYALTASGLLPADRFPKAKDAAIKAIELDEGLAAAHNALAFISYKWDWKWDVAEREFRRAIEIEPTYVLAHQWFSEFLSVIGRHDEALSGFVTARQLDPYSTAIRVDQAASMVRVTAG